MSNLKPRIGDIALCKEIMPDGWRECFVVMEVTDTQVIGSDANQCPIVADISDVEIVTPTTAKE
jgi:hypothetical protein